MAYISKSNQILVKKQIHYLKQISMHDLPSLFGLKTKRHRVIVILLLSLFSISVAVLGKRKQDVFKSYTSAQPMSVVVPKGFQSLLCLWYIIRKQKYSRRLLYNTENLQSLCSNCYNQLSLYLFIASKFHMFILDITIIVLINKICSCNSNFT